MALSKTLKKQSGEDDFTQKLGEYEKRSHKKEMELENKYNVICEIEKNVSK